MSRDKLIARIHNVLDRADKSIRTKMNYELILSNWEIGKLISENELLTEETDLVVLSSSLYTSNGLKIASSELQLYRTFYLQNPIFQKISLNLSWKHYLVLIPLFDDFSREFYQWQADQQKWDPEELTQHIQTDLFTKFKEQRRANRPFKSPTSSANREKESKAHDDLQLLNFFKRLS